MGGSKISLNYLNVGPHFYSPLAQTRQDLVAPVSLTSSTPISVAGGVPDLFQAPLRFYGNTLIVGAGTVFFISKVPRAGEIYGFYDRTMDNTFPYGLGTPNRQGVGMDVDIKALKKYAFKIKGSAYFVKEITSNLVVDPKSGSLTVVDTTAPATQNGVTILPAGASLVRNFTYFNFGPSFDFGPFLDLTTPLEVGVNVRLEQTDSALGTLTSSWFLGGVKVGFFPGVDTTLAFSRRDFNGWEEGITVKPGTTSTTPLARYEYVNGPLDLGSYSPFYVNGYNQSWMASLVLEVNRNSKFYFDYDLTEGNQILDVGPVTGILFNQFISGTYEIRF